VPGIFQSGTAAEATDALGWPSGVHWGHCCRAIFPLAHTFVRVCQGLMATRNAAAERITELSANPKSHDLALRNYIKSNRCEGDASLQVRVVFLFRR
jgi:hypothetical protein